MSTTTEAGASNAPATGRRRTRKPKPAPTGADRIPKPSQGWYRDKVTGDKLRRVTTILNQGCTKGDALTIWAGNITAETAMNNLPTLVKASLNPQERAEAQAWLSRAHVRKKDERRDVGTAVHEIIEAKVLGEPIPEGLLHDPEMRPFLANFLRFVEEWEVEFEASEMVVGNTDDGYAGTLDYLVRSRLIAAALSAILGATVPPESVFMGDTKTGGELDVKGVYPEASLQMAAYRRARVAWLRDGSKVPMPQAYRFGVALHLRPEGYRLLPVDCGDEVYAAFLHVKHVAEWTSGLSKQVIRPALTLPTNTESRAA